jgi:hypothetical protein
MNFFMNFTVYTQRVYDPYATSHFKGHSLIATGSIVNGIVRIVSYPLLAKLADVCHSSTPVPIYPPADHGPTALWPSSWLCRCRLVHGYR